MPPKGWRKYPDGNKEGPTAPQSNSKKDEMYSVEDLLFPRSTILRLAKDVLSDNNISKDSLRLLQRSATVFVNYLFFHANQVASSQERKTLNAQDIIAGLEAADLASFVPTVKRELEQFEKLAAQKKLSKKQRAEELKEKDKKTTEADSSNNGLDSSASPTTKKIKTNKGDSKNAANNSDDELTISGDDDTESEEETEELQHDEDDEVDAHVVEEEDDNDALVSEEAELVGDRDEDIKQENSDIESEDEL